MDGYDLPDPPTPEEYEDTMESEIGQTTQTPEEIARQAENEQALASVGLPSRVKTAFVVFLTEDGQWMANSNLVGTEFEQLPDGRINVTKTGKMPPVDAMAVQRPATLQEIGHACRVVEFDVHTTLVAQSTINGIAQQAQAQMRAMEQQRANREIAERLARGPGGIRGGNIMGPGGTHF